MLKIFTKCLAFSLLCVCFTTQAQRKVGYEFEVGGFFATGTRLPFWMEANNFGVPPNARNTAMIRQKIYSMPDSSHKRLRFSFGIDAAALNGGETAIRLPEAYGQVNVGKIYLFAGRKKQVHGIGDTTLSSGSMTWSGNTLPIPQVQIGFSDFQRLFNGFYFKGHLAHGWYGEQVYSKGSFLHQKSLYFRIGNNNSKIKLYSGVLHSVQWAGTPKYDTYNQEGKVVDGKFADDWFTFSQVFFPRAALVDTTLGYSKFEVENRFGNHVGQIDFAGEINARNFTLRGYRQIPVETGRTIGSLSNLDDGVYGISITNKNKDSFFEKLVVEYLYTLNQHSYHGLIARLLKKPYKEFMNDAFLFNHAQYKDGWSYKGRIIGSPFLIPQKELRVERKIQNDFIFANNNRIRAAYIGFSGKLSNVQLLFKGSFSRNFGAISFPQSPVNQYSYLFSANVPLRKIGGYFRTTIALDQGDLIYDNYGVNVAFVKRW